MRVESFSVRWFKNEQYEIDLIPDDGIEMFAWSASTWAAAGNERAKKIKTEIINVARQMYETYTGDTTGICLRFKDPFVWMNYHLDHDGSVGEGRLLIVFKQENNGNTLRMTCDLDSMKMCAIIDNSDCEQEMPMDLPFRVTGEFRNEAGAVKTPPKPMSLERAVSFVMPFGKHRGSKLHEITTDYLEWFVDKCSSSHPKIAELSAMILAARKGQKNNSI